MDKTKPRLEFLMLLSCVVFGVACLLSESGAQALTVSTEGFTVSFYTNLIATILITISLARMIFLILEVRKQSNAGNNDTKVKNEHSLIIALTMGIAVFFVYGMKNIGFYVSSSITLFVMYMAFEKWDKKELLKGAIFSVGVCIGFAIVFKYLKVFLPNALLF